MAQIILTKNGTGSAYPTALSQGELAINVHSGSLFYGTSGSANRVSASFSMDSLHLVGNLLSGSAGHLTASGNIEATSYVSASEFRTTGHITASAIKLSGLIDSNASSGNNNFETHILLAQDKSMAFGTTNEKITGDGTNLTLGADGYIKLEPTTIVSSSGDIVANRKFAKTETVDDTYNGDVLYFGGGSTTKGDIVYMTTAGAWASAQANATGTSTSMLGIALGTDPDVNGVLIRGTYTLDHDVGNNQGVPLYLSDGTAGQATATAPDSAGDVVRIIGYNLGDDDEIWFDPDKTWVELT